MSGPVDAVTVAAETLALRGRRVKLLPISYGSHSALVEPMLPEFRAIAESVSYAPPRIPMQSTVTGERLTAEQVCSPEYWVSNVRRPVRFHAAVTAVRATRFLELGPDGALTAAAQSAVDGERAVFVPAQRRDKPQDATLLAALGELHAHGVAVDWRTLFVGTGATAVPLPTYAFQRSRYWLGGGAGTPRPVGADPVSQAFERQDIDALAGLLDVGREHLDAVVPALSAWWTTQDEQSTSDALAVPGALAGRRSADHPAARHLARRDGPRRPVDHHGARRARRGRRDHGRGHAHRDDDRAALAERLRAVPQVDGVVSLVAVDETPHPAASTVPFGVAGNLVLAQALGDAQVDAPLWMVTCRGVTAGATSPAGPGAGVGARPGRRP